MNDIEFIKKSVPFVKDFEIIIYDDSDIEIRPTINSDEEEIFTDIGTFMSHYAYKHFLTRTIEGINRESAKWFENRKDKELFKWSIDKVLYDIHVYERVSKFERLPEMSYSVLNGIDQAKRAAIEYVLERI